MTAKRYLSQVYYLDRRIETRLEEIARLRARLTAGVSNPSAEPHGTTVTDWTDTVARIAELESDIQAEIGELARVRTQVASVIAAVEDEKLRTVLELRYLGGKSFGKIARLMRYDYDYTRKLHGQALRSVKIVDETKRNGV